VRGRPVRRCAPSAETSTVSLKEMPAAVTRRSLGD
jgi:hypothetical protein